MHHFVMCLQYWGNKDMKADPDLKDMEARLAAFEKRSWVSCQKDHWVADGSRPENCTPIFENLRMANTIDIEVESTTVVVFLMFNDV